MEASFKGIISADGKLKIYDKAGFQRHCEEQKEKGVIISIITEDTAGSIFSATYFKKVVCGHFRKIFQEHYGEINSEEVISLRLRSWCPACRDKNDVKLLEDMTQEEINYLIKHSKMIAANEFDYYIPD